MTEEEYFKSMFNKVDTLTAICRTNMSWRSDDYLELEIGKTYTITHIGVLKSSTLVCLKEFGRKEFNSCCFDIYENGEFIDHEYTQDPRFLAPYRREYYAPEYWAKEMKEVAIPAHLKSIEKQFDVKILLAVESGSRAWGFESQNSDWDVRFIYVHKPEWYFKIEEQRDVIEYMYDDDVDLSGWELRKALSLLKKSNPSLLEWFHSPMVYYKDEAFGQRIAEVEQHYFNPIKSMYHYNRIYNKHNEHYLKHPGYDMKRFLYYLRGVLACRWIETTKTIPPVSFKALYMAIVDDGAIREKIDNLIAVKKRGCECDITLVDKDLLEYAQVLANHYNETIDSFRPELDKSSAAALDSILYDMVRRYADK